MSSHDDFRDWTQSEEDEKARIRAIHIDIPKDIRDAAHQASVLHEDPYLVIAEWMRDRCAKIAEQTALKGITPQDSAWSTACRSVAANIKRA